MNKTIVKPLLIIFIILSIVVFLISFYDILYEKGWTIVVFALYAVFFIIALSLLFILPAIKENDTGISKTKSLKKLERELNNYKCPECKAIFSIKKTQSNTNKPFTITCPTCGIIGKITPSPGIVIDTIPDKKSDSIVFTCHNCKERFSIWIEGKDITKDFKVYSCPYCGKIHES
ncbi:MAG: hypothetical protein R6V50_02910 [Thermoplasmatota archaeon]